MKLQKLYRSVDLALDIDRCWEFFSNPQNLKLITPSFMGFDIIEGGSSSMYAGQIIAYKVSPVMNVKMTWVTEITHVKKERFFVDEQRFGPYKFWHHKHFFEEIEGGVRCRDEVHYIPPGRFLAPLINKLFIASKLKQIFDYRSSYLVNRFGLASGNNEKRGE